ncbi:hypothetical protein [Glycomyces tarimensis]
MSGVQLIKIFAWVIGVLSLLWLFVQCLGGPDPTEGPSEREIEQDVEEYAEDCRRAREALELLSEVDHENVDFVTDEIDTIATDIRDPQLSQMAYSFASRAEEMVAGTEPGDTEELRENYELYRGLVEIDLSLRCAGSGAAAD